MRRQNENETKDNEYVHLWCLITAAQAEPGGSCHVKPLATPDNPAPQNGDVLMLPSGVVGNFPRVQRSINGKLYVKVRTEYIKRLQHMLPFFDDDERKTIKDYCE